MGNGGSLPYIPCESCLGQLMVGRMVMNKAIMGLRLVAARAWVDLTMS